MPMIARIASGTITGPSGIALGAPTRLITSATVSQPGNALANLGGTYGIFWSFTQTSACTGAGSAQVPCFTWYDGGTNAATTATGGAFGWLVGGGVTSSVTGAAVSALYGVSAVAGNKTRGVEVFNAGSGASGASAYIQVSSVGTSHDGVYRFDYQIYCLDLWGV